MHRTPQFFQNPRACCEGSTRSGGRVPLSTALFLPPSKGHKPSPLPCPATPAGATNGMADNFQTVSSVMREYAAVEDVSRLPRAKTLVRRRSRRAREEAEGLEEEESEEEVEGSEMESEGEEGPLPSKEGSPRPPQSPILESLVRWSLAQGGGFHCWEGDFWVGKGTGGGTGKRGSVYYAESPYQTAT